MWCYISKSHIPLRLGASYFWSWFAAAVMLLVYGALWSKLRRLVSTNATLRQTDVRVSDIDLEELREQRAGSRESTGETEDSVWLRREAAKMLWYPFCYIVSKRYSERRKKLNNFSSRSSLFLSQQHVGLPSPTSPPISLLQYLLSRHLFSSLGVLSMLSSSLGRDRTSCCLARDQS